MANIQNKKTANSFQDELDMMFDGINMDNYADNLNADGSDALEQLMGGASLVKAMPKSKPDDLDKLLMVAEMERPGPKIVNIKIKSEKKHDIDSLLNALSDTTDDTLKAQAKGGDVGLEFGIVDEDNDAETLRSAVRSIAANKAFDSAYKDGLDKRDDFEAFDEFGEIGGFEGGNNAVVDRESKAESLVDLEKNFGVQFNNQKTNADDFDPFNAAADLIEDAEQIETSGQTLSEVQNKLDEYLKLVAEKTHVDDARRANEKPVVATEPAAQSSEMVEYEIVEDKVQDSQDEGENWFLEPETTATLEPEATDSLAENSVGNINPSKDSLDENALSEFLVISTDDSELPVPKHTPETPLAETSELFEKLVPTVSLTGIKDADDAVETSIAIGSLESVVNPDAGASKNEVDINPALMAAQISELWVAHNLIKQQVVDFTQLKNNVEQLDKIVQLESKERKERKKPLDLTDNNTSKKVPGLVYAAAGISALSLLIGGGMFAYGVSLSADVKELQAHIASLEGDLALINQANAPTAPTSSSEDLNAAQIAARVKILGTRTPVAGNTEDFAQDLEKQAKPLLPNTIASTQLSQDTQIKPDQAIRVIAANNKAHAAAPKGAHAASQWVANLMSVRQEWYAKSKVAEFAKQGITAVVTPIDVKGEAWYILRSAGFATQEQALEFAAKAKQSLHLASILVTQSE
ncbi:MAG: SPOR domain-containing protein [Methylococcales bacterium]